MTSKAVNRAAKRFFDAPCTHPGTSACQALKTRFNLAPASSAGLALSRAAGQEEVVAKFVVSPEIQTDAW